MQYAEKKALKMLAKMTPVNDVSDKDDASDKDARKDAKRNSYPTSVITCPTALIPHYTAFDYIERPRKGDNCQNKPVSSILYILFSGYLLVRV